MILKTLAKWQIVIGIVSIIFWIVNFITTGVLTERWYVGTDNTFLLLLGIFAILTGYYNSKQKR